jgi:molybdopterin synthase catalytic subunit
MSCSPIWSRRLRARARMSEVYAVISDQPLSVEAIEASVLDSAHGALVTFRGIVRNHDHGEAVTALDYSAHPDAHAFLEECCREVASSSGLRVAAAHRVGSLVVGDVALVAAVAAPHRAAAFEATEQLVARSSSSACPSGSASTWPTA